MGQEAKLQSKILDYLEKEDGWMVNKLIKMSRNGWPDIIAVKNGKTVFIEVKSKGLKPIPLQDYVINNLNKSGVIAFWCDSMQMFYDKMNDLEL